MNQELEYFLEGSYLNDNITSQIKTADSCLYADDLAKDKRTRYLNAILKKLHEAGYECGVYASVSWFAGNLNGYVLSFQRLMRQLNSMALQHDLDLSQFITSSDELLQSITRILPENLNKIVNFSYSFGATMFEWIISFILAIYLMLGSDKLKAGLGRLLHAILPAQVYRNTSSFWSRCNKILVQFIAFDVLDGIIIGLCNWVFMVIMGMPYVAIISAIVGVTNLAPTFGPMVGAIIGAFILVLVKPWYALAFLLFTLVLQTRRPADRRRRHPSGHSLRSNR